MISFMPIFISVSLASKVNTNSYVVGIVLGYICAVSPNKRSFFTLPFFYFLFSQNSLSKQSWTIPCENSELTRKALFIYFVMICPLPGVKNVVFRLDFETVNSGL